PSGALQAEASTAVTATLNLDGRVDPLDPNNFDPNDGDSYSYANNVTLFDSQGNAHNTTMYFIKTADNEWQVRLTDSQGAEPAYSGTPPTPPTLSFDSNGVLTAAANSSGLTFAPGGGVADITLDLAFDETSQFGREFELSAVSQDG